MSSDSYYPSPRGLHTNRSNLGHNSIGNELASFIKRYTWDYFFTITPQWPRRDSIAYIRDLRIHLLTHGADRAFIACETFKLNNNLHAHGLLHHHEKGVKWPANHWWKLLRQPIRRATGGIAASGNGRTRVEVINNPQNVSHYCSKYVSKLSDGDNYDFIGKW